MPDRPAAAVRRRDACKSRPGHAPLDNLSGEREQCDDAAAEDRAEHKANGSRVALHVVVSLAHPRGFCCSLKH